ncbi:hypothetical protein QJS10_CPA05g00247 [Acorus calamus]|uniref:Serine/threonine-protein phosphatase 4 regulatory subunit 3-like central domain-containing protein n=1 Tax=Acorus calamus TaxID=4465 RepID=A0AAV9EXT9_ACOCL|nr:hypothetical protein QJS10_CPA05g00247 [Acorus calamus]
MVNLTSFYDPQRVKFYRLTADGKWDDQGTGLVTVDYVERSENLGLLVFDEDNHDPLLVHRISSDDIYRRQDDVESGSCLAAEDLPTSGAPQSNDDTYHVVSSELRELPPVELSSLHLLLKTVVEGVEGGVVDQIRVTELILKDQYFFPKLIDLFRISEDLENLDVLHMLFKLVKGINDPEVPKVQRHRDFLKKHVVFKQAIPIKDAMVSSKIHQTYWIGYLKCRSCATDQDVILQRVLDEAIIANFNAIIHANNAVIVSLLKDDTTFIQELFRQMRSSATPADSKRNLVLFLQEFCNLSKSLQLVQQLRLFRDLVNEGIFDIITNMLQSEDQKLVLTGTDILILFLNQDPNFLRTYVIHQEGNVLLGLLVKGMITDFGEDMHCQFLEIIRSLLDPYTLTGLQRDTIIDVFFEKHLDQLIDVITSSCPSKVAGKSGDSGGNIGTFVEAFIKNGNRYNLLHSAVLELFEYIRKENLKALIIYVVDSFWEEISKFGYLSSIQAFKLKYEQSLESAESRNTISVDDSRKRIDDRAVEKEEEDYFNEHSSQSGKLVDYDDDEDDADYNPPPRIKPGTSAEENETENVSSLKQRPLSSLKGNNEELELTKKRRTERTLSNSPSRKGPGPSPRCSIDSSSDPVEDPGGNECTVSRKISNGLPEAVDSRPPNGQDLQSEKAGELIRCVLL